MGIGQFFINVGLCVALSIGIVSPGRAGVHWNWDWDWEHEMRRRSSAAPAPLSPAENYHAQVQTLYACADHLSTFDAKLAHEIIDRSVYHALCDALGKTQGSLVRCAEIVPKILAQDVVSPMMLERLGDLAARLETFGPLVLAALRREAEPGQSRLAPRGARAYLVFLVKQLHKLSSALEKSLQPRPVDDPSPAVSGETAREDAVPVIDADQEAAFAATRETLQGFCQRMTQLTEYLRYTPEEIQSFKLRQRLAPARASYLSQMCTLKEWIDIVGRRDRLLGCKPADANLLRGVSQSLLQINRYLSPLMASLKEVPEEVVTYSITGRVLADLVLYMESLGVALLSNPEDAPRERRVARATLKLCALAVREFIGKLEKCESPIAADSDLPPVCPEQSEGVRHQILQELARRLTQLSVSLQETPEQQAIPLEMLGEIGDLREYRYEAAARPMLHDAALQEHLHATLSLLQQSLPYVNTGCAVLPGPAPRPMTQPMRDLIALIAELQNMR